MGLHKINPESNAMPLSLEQIFETVRANVQKVLFDVDPSLITMDVSLTDLGANSIDRVEVAMYSMEDLKVNVPRQQLAAVENLRGLVDLLHKNSA